MKKAGYVVIILTVMLCIFVCGFLVGRNMNRSSITVMEYTTIAPDSIDTTVTAGKININTASVDELTLLPGIGSTLAQRIVDYRSSIGPFRTVSDLSNVEGIGDQKLLSILDYITI